MGGETGAASAGAGAVEVVGWRRCMRSGGASVVAMAVLCCALQWKRGVQRRKPVGLFGREMCRCIVLVLRESGVRLDAHDADYTIFGKGSRCCGR